MVVLLDRIKRRLRDTKAPKRRRPLTRPLIIELLEDRTTPSQFTTNIALNPSASGYPSPLESDRGWGGGAQPWEIVDGQETYAEWYHGLAFTGGHTGGWGSGGWVEPAGPRQATIDFGQLKVFDEVVVWHHGENHVPATANLQAWNGTNWVDIPFNRTYAPSRPFGDWSIPDEYDFNPVVGSKVRYSFDNSGANILGEPITHGWLYEFEVFGGTPPELAPPGPAVLQASSDTGLSATDNITRADSPVFDVAQAGNANTVQLLREGLVVGSRVGPGPVADSGGVPDGTYAYAARQVGPDGNVSLASMAVSVTIDRTPPETPTLPALAPADDSGAKGDGLTAIRQPHWTGKAEPGSLVQLLDASGYEFGSAIAAGDGSYSIAPQSALDDGVYHLHGRDVDVAGNPSADGTTIDITIDGTPPPQPAQPALAPSDLAGTLGALGYTRARQPHLTGSAEPKTSLQFLDASGTIIAQTTAASDGRYSIMLNGLFGDGPFTVAVRAIDAAGNVSAASSAVTFSVSPSLAVSPVLVVITHGQQFDPFGSGRRDQRGDWVDQLADGIQQELMTGLRGSSVPIKVIEPNWDTFGGSNRPAEFMADYVKRITDDPSLSPDPWDILLVGHSRGAIFNHNLAKLLGGDARIDFVEEILLDPTAAHVSGDQYPQGVPDPVAHLIDYDDRRSLQEVFGKAAEDMGRALGGRIGFELGKRSCRSLGALCAFVGENVGKIIGADLGRDLGRHSVTDGVVVPGPKAEYRDVRSGLDQYLAIHPRDPRAPGDLAAQSHSAMHDWYLASPYLRRDIADFLSRKDHGATASGATDVSPVVLPRETVLPPSDAPTLARFIEDITAKVKAALRNAFNDAKVLIQRITGEGVREIRQVLTEAKRTVREIEDATRRAGRTVRREAAREIRQVQREASRTVQNINREVKAVTNKVSRTIKKLRKHF
jgi:hypothetical protein